MRTLLVIAALAACGYAGWTRVTATTPVQSDLEAPTLADGKPFDIHQFALGKPHIINIWASWCSTCAHEAAFLKQFSDTHPGQVLGIDMQEEPSAGRAAVAEWGWTYPNLVDRSGALVDRLSRGSNKSLATTYFFAADRHSVCALSGAVDVAPALFDQCWRKAGGT